MFIESQLSTLLQIFFESMLFSQNILKSFSGADDIFYLENSRHERVNNVLCFRWFILLLIYFGLQNDRHFNCNEHAFKYVVAFDP